MKTRLLRNMFIVGSAALALAASTVVLPSVADAAGHMTRVSHGGGHGHARAGSHFRGRGVRGGYGYGGGGYLGGYYGGFCPPIIGVLTGACLPYGY